MIHKNKTLLLFATFLLFLSSRVNAQNATVDKQGNYHPIRYPLDSTATGRYYVTNKGDSLPVFTDRKGLFYGRVNKQGKYYRSRIKTTGK